jgi:DNA-binding NarL/FixJ family response regulator
VQNADSVLVVEDDGDTRRYLAQALGAGEAPYRVTTAATLREGLAALKDTPPRVLLVDLGLPDGNGLELIRAARAQSSAILPLVITVFGDEGSVIGAIEAGAQGYILKSEAPDDLREAVAQVIAGGAPISPGIASHLLRHFGESAPQGPRTADGPRLTGREQDVLKLLVKGLLYQEVAEALAISRNTVASHVKSIYRKLEVGSRGEAVFEALSRGIVKVDPGD